MENGLFFWQEFCGINNECSDENFINVPSLWNNQMINAIKIPSDGFGTYRLKILIKKSDELFGLKILNVIYNRIGDWRIHLKIFNHLKSICIEIWI
ncbi:MAG: hypothetical protein KDK90_26830, partial [Leptospiraceae bacterium]|nr:hypothetical protein [Leptospiraceae bacterium]